MTPSLESLTTAALSLALEAATRRQQAFTANIAHANVDGYTPVRVAFEEHLAQARAALREGVPLHASALADARIVLEPSLPSLPAQPGPGGAAPVRLDEEVAGMAANAVHYQALVQGLSRHLSLLAAAAASGRK